MMRNFKISLSKSYSSLVVRHLHTFKSDLMPFFCIVRYFRVAAGLTRLNNSRCQSMLLFIEVLSNVFRK